MTESQQPPTMRSSRNAEGRFNSGMQPHNHSGWLTQEKVGHQWGWVKLVSREFVRKKGHRHVHCQCAGCGEEKLINYDSLRKGSSKGCQSCSQKCGAPAWLLRRLEAARQRCTNPQDAGYCRYGARGVEFRFSSVASAAVWVMDNMEIHKDKELDRIDNNGHYEPENLRFVSRIQNMANRRDSKVAAFHNIRREHPEVRYADNTLWRLLREGLTEDQIVERFHRPSDKPKGVYGTYSTPDPDIVSLYLDD